MLDKGRHLELLDLMGPDELSMAKTKIKIIQFLSSIERGFGKKKKRRDGVAKRLEYEIDEKKANIL